MTLNGLGNLISIKRDRHGHGSGRIFQRTLPGMKIAFVHNAAQRNARLLYRTYIARDVHQNQSLRLEVV
jgi:hypothetical protein